MEMDHSVVLDLTPPFSGSFARIDPRLPGPPSDARSEQAAIC